VADPEGQVVKGGSKVVKNVAGYDLPKLYTGSWGTLGLLSELTFRVIPLPERRETVTLALPDFDAAEAVLAAAMDSDLQPVFIELLNEAACASLLPLQAPGVKLAFGIDGAREDVEWQIDHLTTLGRSEPGAQVEVLHPEVGRAFRRSLADFPLALPSRFTARANVPSSEVSDVMRHAQVLGEDHGHRIIGGARAGVGILVLHAVREAALTEESEALLVALRGLTAAKRGRVTVERAAPDLEGRIEPWPDAGDGLPVMRDLKRSLDPKGLWNPGRLML
jgi:glycolate oxidase FAD binding subunit